MSRFVKPETKILRISGGDTLTVKRRLNSGEKRAAFARMSESTPSGELRVNRLQVGVAMIVSYLMDWSLTDDNGVVVQIREQPPEVVTAALDALDDESYAEIRDAIELHDAETRTAREQEKNGLDGANGSSAISPSPVVAAGDTNGLVN